MAKLYFRYSSMDAGKTLDLLKVAYNYKDRGQHVLVLNSSIDSRAGANKVRSRIGLEQDARSLSPKDNIFNFVKDYISKTNIDCILIDEIHFFTAEQILQISDVVDYLNTPIICYGLRTDYRGKTFPPAQVLLGIADTLEEVKTICFCGKKATMNMMIKDGVSIKEGESIVVDDYKLGKVNMQYASVCRKHWKEGKFKL